MSFGLSTTPASAAPPSDSPGLLLLDELRDAWQTEPRTHRVALICIVVIGVALRFAYIDQPMRYDESVTYLYFVKHPWAAALSNYQYPNNHLFHTALAKISVTLFGGSPQALRVPAFLAGVVVVPATYAAARELYGARAALIAAAMVAASSALVLFSTNARGYTFVVLAFLLLVLVGVRILRADAPSAWAEFVIIGWLGAWTIPIMLYPFGAICVWLVLSLLLAGRTAELRKLAMAVGGVGALTLASYWPVIRTSGLASITSNAFVRSSDWFQFFQELPNTLAEALLGWAEGVPLIVMIGFLAAAVVALRRHASVSRVTVGLPLAAFIWCSWLLAVNHRAPFARVWLWFFPIAAALAGAGLLRLADGHPRLQRLSGDRLPLVAVSIALAFAVSMGWSRSVLRSAETGAYPDAPEVAAWLRHELRPGDHVHAPIPANSPLEYYADRLGMSPEIFQRDDRAANRVFSIVERRPGQSMNNLTVLSAPTDTAAFRPDSLVSFMRSAVVIFARRNAK